RLRRVSLQFMEKPIGTTLVGGCLKSQSAGEFLQLFRFLRQFIKRAVVDDAQPILDHAQGIVNLQQRLKLTYVKQTPLVCRVKRFTSVRRAQLREFAAVTELEELHQELDIHDTAETTFQVAFTAAGFKSLAHLPDFTGVFASPRESKCRLLN